MGGGPTHPGPVARVIPVRGLRPIDGDRPTDRSVSLPFAGGDKSPSLQLTPSLPKCPGRQAPGVAGPLGTGTSPLQHSTYWTTPTAPRPPPAPARAAGDAHRDHPSTGPPAPITERTTR